MELTKKRGLSIVALTTARTAGDMLREMRLSAIVTEQRGPDLTTSADLASEEMIIRLLRATDPTIPAYSEEGRGEIPESGLGWVIDPLDGTHNYLHGCGLYGVSIALLENRVPVMGVVYFPKTHGLYQGHTGFFTGFQTTGHMAVSGETNLAKSVAWTDWSKQPAENTLALLDRLKDCSCYPTMPMCATQGLIMVATGKIQAYIHPQPAIEDHAAAGLLVQLAGGRVTDIYGNPWTPFSTSIMATNGYIHEELLDAVNDVV